MADSPIELKLDDRRLTDVVDLIAQIKASGQLKNYRDFYGYHRNITASRYRQAAAATPFAKGSLGRKKPKSGRTVPDGFFGIDSGALFSDVVNNRRITEDGLTYFSELEYSAYIMALFAEKGPFAPNSVLFIDDSDLEKAEEIVADNFAKAIENG
jgi:hypothetical protein